MSLEEFQKRETYFKEFGEILNRRHGQNYYASFHNEQRLTVDEASVRFGRYVRAARVNANLSIRELAAKAHLTEARLIAIEQGLILACDIKPKWLKDLADVLQENVEDFNLILGRQISSGHSRWLTERLIIYWRNWLAYYKILITTKPLYAACSAVLLCVVLGLFSFFSLNSTSSTPLPSHENYTFIDIKPERRLNLIKAEMRLESSVAVLSSNLTTGNCCRY